MITQENNLDYTSFLKKGLFHACKTAFTFDHYIKIEFHKREVGATILASSSPLNPAQHACVLVCFETRWMAIGQHKYPKWKPLSAPRQLLHLSALLQPSPKSLKCVCLLVHIGCGQRWCITF